MPVDACARAIVRAAAQRRRELIVPFIVRIGLWIGVIAPWLLDRYAARVMAAER
jgi:hypothetical protein